MTHWRMAFRVGNQGTSLWPQCFDRGIAAITYSPLEHTDLSRVPESVDWSDLAPTQISSLRSVAYEMKPDDIIFVKDGPSLVGKGRIVSSYYFDDVHCIVDENGMPWPHQLKVDWSTGFPRVELLLGAEQITVRKLTKVEVDEVENSVSSEDVRETEFIAFEGKATKAEVDLLFRNRTLVSIKKQLSDCRCEICNFKYQELYGQPGAGFIIAHHLKPISSGPRVNRLEDIALVCANCHSMIHTRNPPYSIEEMKALIQQN